MTTQQLPTANTLSLKERAYAVDLNTLQDNKGEIVLDKDAINQSLKNIILGYTGCKSRIFDQKFGSMTYFMLGEPLDNVTAAKLREGLIQAFEAHEPRISVSISSVIVKADSSLPGYLVSVFYTVVSTNQSSNATFNLRTA
jgi:phage baseplate assembly protein W